MEKTVYVVPKEAEKRIYDELAGIVGDRFVSNDAGELYVYSKDIVNPGHKPGGLDFVAMPETTEEVQKIVLLANREKIPIRPRFADTGTGAGMNVPAGGIVLDLRRMNEIYEVDEEGMYALIQPGVTFSELDRYLREHDPDLWFGHNMGPQNSTIGGCLFTWGMMNHNYISGAGSDLIASMEVVTPTGEIIRTGCAGYNDQNWQQRPPVPDLGGLFDQWSGATGIVTKMAIHLLPKCKMSMYIILANSYRDIIDRISLPIVKADLGELWHMSLSMGMVAQTAGPLMGINIPSWLIDKATGLKIFTLVVLGAHTEEELRTKEKSFKKIVRDGNGMCLNVGSALNVLGKMVDFRMMPSIGQMLALAKEEGYTQPDAWMYSGLFAMCAGNVGWAAGGLCCDGGFMPNRNISAFYEDSERWSKEEYGEDICNWYRFMKHGHVANVRIDVHSFDRSDKERTRWANKRLRGAEELYYKHGGVPYRPNADLKAMMREKMDPSTREFMKKLQEFLDPNNIMNPTERW